MTRVRHSSLPSRTLTAQPSYAALLERARREVRDLRHAPTHHAAEFLELARRWGNTIECNDAFTQGHCDRVADLACALAAADGMDEESLFWVRVGALLHDVGKVVVPAEVLNKRGALTDDEWQVVRSHTLAGVDLVRGVEFPAEVMDILQSHHERWDGGGYPHGLAGHSIPRAARIVCIADAYDALTSTRSYKMPRTHDDALAVMRGDGGTHFDPVLLVLFESTVEAWTAGRG